MADRYTILNDYDTKFWIAPAPVLIEKYRILNDNINSKIVLQIQYRNLEQKSIYALHICVRCYDYTGTYLGDTRFSYLDLKDNSFALFGNNIPIVLEYNDARKFEFIVEKVAYSDRDCWMGPCTMASINKQALSLLPPILASQFKKEIGVSCAAKNEPLYEPAINLSYWECTCGNINLVKYDLCANCGLPLNVIKEKYNIEYLQQEINVAKNIKLKQQKKNKKIAVIASCFAFILLAIFLFINIVIPTINSKQLENRYNEALVLAQNQEYESAIKILTELGDYKDATNLISSYQYELDYQKAIVLWESENHVDAIAIFRTISDYKNSNDFISQYTSEEKYYQALMFMDSGDYKSAYDLFKQLNLTDDENYKECCYNLGIEKFDEDDYISAKIYFDYIPDYKDSNEYIEQSLINAKLITQYEKALEYYENGQYKEALDILGALPEDFKDSSILIENYEKCSYKYLLGSWNEKGFYKNGEYNEHRSIQDSSGYGMIFFLNHEGQICVFPNKGLFFSASYQVTICNDVVEWTPPASDDIYHFYISTGILNLNGKKDSVFYKLD